MCICNNSVVKFHDSNVTDKKLHHEWIKVTVKRLSLFTSENWDTKLYSRCDGSLTTTHSWVPVVPYLRLLWSNFCITGIFFYVLMLLFTFVILVTGGQQNRK